MIEMAESLPYRSLAAAPFSRYYCQEIILFFFCLSLLGWPGQSTAQPDQLTSRAYLGSELQLLELDGEARLGWGWSGGLQWQRWELGVFGTQTLASSGSRSYRSSGFSLAYFQPALPFLRVTAGVRFGWSDLRPAASGSAMLYRDQLRSLAPQAGVDILLWDRWRLRATSAFQWVSDASPHPKEQRLNTLVNSIGLLFFFPVEN